MSHEQSAPGFGNLDLNSQLWMQGHLETLRRDYQTQLREVLTSLIESVDDAQRLRNDPAFDDLPGVWKDGINAMHNKLLQRLVGLGVTPIEAVGKTVDPRLHHVVDVVSGEDAPETIVREELAGYLCNDMVLRAAKVVSVRRD